jgi:predicted nucleic acid-binding protein
MTRLLPQCNKNTPSAWMMLINIPDCILNSVQNRVLNGDYFNRAQADYFSLAPRKQLLMKYKDQKLSFHDALCVSVMKREGIFRIFTFDKHFWLFGFEVFPGATH